MKQVIYLISIPDSTHDIMRYFSKTNYETKIFTSLGEGVAAAQKKKPDIMLVDEDMFQNSQHVDNLVQFVSASNMPLILLVAQDAFNNKLQAVRCGAAAILKKPLVIEQLLETVDSFLIQRMYTKKMIHVIILENSVSVSQHYKTILEQAGMFVVVVNEPRYIFDILKDFIPDVFVIDRCFRDCTGIEIASMLRLEASYKSIPIIFTAMENDLYGQLSMMHYTGGSELFLTKPIVPQNLIAAIESKAKYGSVIQQQIFKDGLTNLFNHAYILQCLNLEFERAKRSKENFVIAMIDLDNFKYINDTYGHLVGSYILKKVAGLLMSNSRRIDRLGRYGGDEFMLILPHMTAENAQLWCERIRKVVAKAVFSVEQSAIHVTVSIGLAFSEDYRSAADIMTAADKAMYAAKASGHNRVCTA